MNAPLASKEKSSSDQKGENSANDQAASTAVQSQRNSAYDLSKASHPILCFLAICLKAAAILW